jgi:hypothetical protein
MYIGIVVKTEYETVNFISFIQITFSKVRIILTLQMRKLSLKNVKEFTCVTEGGRKSWSWYLSPAFC